MAIGASAGAPTGGGGGVSSQSPSSPGGGSSSADGGGGGSIAGLGEAVQSFNQQPALTEGRSYIMCLIKAYKARYTNARNALQSVSDTIAVAKGRFVSEWKFPIVYAKLDELYKNLNDPNTFGFKVEFDAAVQHLSEGEKCFPQNLSKDDTAACYQKFTGPLVSMKQLSSQLDGLYKMVGDEGTETIQAAMNQHGMDFVYSGALGYINDTIEASQNQINAAKGAITGMYAWGDQGNVDKLKYSFAPAYATAKIRLTDLSPEKLPRDRQGKFEAAQRDALMNLESANTQWSQYDQNGDKLDEIGVYIEANRLTEFASMSLAEAAIAAKIREAPADGGNPSPQLSAIRDEGPNRKNDGPACDVDAPDPPDDGKK